MDSVFRLQEGAGGEGARKTGARTLAAGFFENLASQTGARTATAGNPEFALEVAHRPGASHGGVGDVLVGNGVADANVHGACPEL